MSDQMAARVKALRRIARSGGFPRGADAAAIKAMHGANLSLVCRFQGPEQDLIDYAFSNATDQPFDRAINNILRPDEKLSMREQRQQLMEELGVSVKTIERYEIQGAQAFIGRIDAAIELTKSDEFKAHQQDWKHVLLVAIVRELLRDNPDAEERVNKYLSPYIGAMVTVGDRPYGTQELFDEVLSGDPISKFLEEDSKKEG